MLITDCTNCCFMDNGRCAAKQWQVEKDGIICAPGYCRHCRSQKWRNKQNTNEVEILIDRLREDNRNCCLELIVAFDENSNTQEDLERTIYNQWYASYVKKITIADTTGFGKRKNIAVDFVKQKKSDIPLLVNISAEKEGPTEIEGTIRRISSDVKQLHFLVVPAGGFVYDFANLIEHVGMATNRAIYWKLPVVFRGSETVMSFSPSVFGLYLTKPYRRIIHSSKDKTFSQQLKEEEASTGIELSWLFNGCLLVC